MKKNKIVCSLVFIFSAFLLSPFLRAAEPSHTKYIIITFERFRKNSQHDKETFFWITTTDSINEDNTIIYPVYLEGFSDQKATACCDGTPTNLFTLTTASSFDKVKNNQKKIILLKNIINNNRKLTQTIIKQWPSGEKEIVKVFITPIEGHFCNCKYNFKDNYDKVYIYYENSEFKFDNNFWKSNKSRYVLSVDFSSYRLASN